LAKLSKTAISALVREVKDYFRGFVSKTPRLKREERRILRLVRSGRPHDALYIMGYDPGDKINRRELRSILRQVGAPSKDINIISESVASYKKM